MAPRVKQALDRLRNKSTDDNKESNGNKRKQVQFEDNQQDSTDEAETSQDKKRYKEDCFLHLRGDKKCGQKYGECSANPDRDNKSFRLHSCKKVLGRKDIAEKFSWYVEQCWKHQRLTTVDGIPLDRTNSYRQNDTRNNEQQPQQQQFQFLLPANIPPVPLGSTIQIIPPHSPQAAPSQGTLFAFGRQPLAPATTQQASGGGRWVLNQQGVWQLE